METLISPMELVAMGKNIVMVSLDTLYRFRVRKSFSAVSTPPVKRVKGI